MHNGRTWMTARGSAWENARGAEWPEAMDRGWLEASSNPCFQSRGILMKSTVNSWAVARSQGVRAGTAGSSIAHR
jgi:hypothetical protein